MSLYRKTVQDGSLIWEKRKLLPRLTGWQWVFNRSDEDHLNKMKNELLKARAASAILTRRIPHEEDRLKKIKEGLEVTGMYSTPVRDAWRPRTEPIRLLEKVSVGRKKKDRLPERKAHALATIVAGRGV
jgi:hypothetical protein